MKITITAEESRIKRALFEAYKAGYADALYCDPPIHEGDVIEYDETPDSIFEHVSREVVRTEGTVTREP